MSMTANEVPRVRSARMRIGMRAWADRLSTTRKAARRTTPSTSEVMVTPEVHESVAAWVRP
jgi:hypothetical protein